MLIALYQFYIKNMAVVENDIRKWIYTLKNITQSFKGEAISTSYFSHEDNLRRLY